MFFLLFFGLSGVIIAFSSMFFSETPLVGDVPAKFDEGLAQARFGEKVDRLGDVVATLATCSGWPFPEKWRDLTI